MKIAFTHLSTEGIEGQPPLGVAYICSYVRKYSPDVDVSIVDKERNTLKAIKREKPDVVGISCVTKEFARAVELAKQIKSELDVPVVLGGNHITIMPQTMSDAFNVGIVGEGEETTRVVLENKLENLDKIKGIVYHKDSHLVMNPRRELITPLDRIPYPARDLFKMEKEYLVPRRAGTAGKVSRATHMFSCYDNQTEILTENGWKFFKDLNKTDKVATLNPKTKELEYYKPKRIMKYDYNNFMYEVDNKQINLLITPNHKVYVKRQNRKDFELLEIEKVSQLVDLEFKKDAIWHGKEEKYFIIPGVKHRYNFMNGKQENLPLKMSMDTWLEFLGYYLSEGCCTKKSNNRYIIKICQSSEKNKKKYDKIEKCIKQLGYNYYRNKDYFEISNKQLYNYLKRFGKCHQKYIPKEIKQLTSRQLRILLDALILGDGYINKNGVEIYVSTSKKLIDDFQEITLKIGYSANYNTHSHLKNAMIKNRIIKSKRKCYHIIINKKQNTPRINNNAKKQITKKKYNEAVYCCEVRNHIVYVRRNGKPCWSGNSRGCPYSCRFCSSSHFWQRKFRMFSPEYVVGEMKELVDKYRVEEILIFDDLFASDAERLKKIVHGIKEEGINQKVNFGCLSRVDIINDERMKLLKEMNVSQIDYGFESGSQKILNYLKRDTTTVEMNRKAIELTKKYGINIHGFFVIGAPDETKEDMMKTLNFIKENKIDTVTLCVLTPYPGTEVWDEAKQRGLVSEDMDWSLLDLTPEKGKFIYLNKKMSKEEFLQIYEDFKKQIEGEQYVVKFKMKQLLSPFVMKYAVTHPGEAWKYFYNTAKNKIIRK